MWKGSSSLVVNHFDHAIVVVVVANSNRQSINRSLSEGPDEPVNVYRLLTYEGR